MPGAQLQEQVQDLRLDRDVEGRRRLVEDQQPRLEGQGPGDRHPLALPPGKLVRPPVEVAPCETHPFEQLEDRRFEGAPRRPKVGSDGFGHEVEDAESRVQGPDRVLEDQLHLATECPQSDALQPQHVAPVELDRARARLDEAQDAAGQGRLARAGFADQGMHLARPDVEIDAGDGPHDVAVGAERLLEAAHADEERGGGHGLSAVAAGDAVGPAAGRPRRREVRRAHRMPLRPARWHAARWPAPRSRTSACSA